MSIMVEPPLPAMRFLVTLDMADAYLPPAQAALVSLVALGQFSHASGLGAELEVTPYREGGRNDFVHQLPVGHSWDRIMLKTGVVRGPGLWTWYQLGLTQSLGARRDGTVMLLTPAGTPAMAWAFRAGLAAKWTGPELDALDAKVAIESLEIAHQGLTPVLLSLPGTG
jgi:phage tail-like protein